MLPVGGRAMPNSERYALYAAFAVLWVSGVWWLILNVFFSEQGEFGTVPHAWQAPLLLMHGVVSVPVLYLIGWAAARHSCVQWRTGKRRVSGGSFAAALTVLVVSGFALFFLTRADAQAATALAHEVVGVMFALLLLEHWFFGRRKPADDA